MEKLIKLYTEWSGAEPVSTEQLAGAGSNRQYYRFTSEDGSTVIGVVLGSLVGYFGGWVDTQYQGSAWRSSGEGCWTLRLQYAFQKRYGRNT